MENLCEWTWLCKQIHIHGGLSLVDLFARWWNCSWQIEWFLSKQTLLKQMSCDETSAARCAILHGDKFQNCFSGIIFIPAWKFKSNRCYCDRKKNYGSSIHVRKIYIRILPRSFYCGKAVVYAPLPTLICICICGPKFGVSIFSYLKSLKTWPVPEPPPTPTCSRGMRRLSSSGNSALTNRWHLPSFGALGPLGWVGAPQLLPAPGLHDSSIKSPRAAPCRQTDCALVCPYMQDIRENRTLVWTRGEEEAGSFRQDQERLKEVIAASVTEQRWLPSDFQISTATLELQIVGPETST